MYEPLKLLHIAFAVVSVTGFVARALLAAIGSTVWQRRGIRLLTHGNDTLLLAAGVTLSILSHQYPFAQPWLTAKLAAVVLYIVLGALALRPALPAAVRTVCGFGALAVVAYVIHVAITKNPAF
ncbi:MAG TPA: SirB2 family protein [Rhodocyclaceae bacterium]|nr:SirB2 family protein [Rhodocyclaceae bacterium]